jgi:predicted amidohydrolase YtcJ
MNKTNSHSLFNNACYKINCADPGCSSGSSGAIGSMGGDGGGGGGGGGVGRRGFLTNLIGAGAAVGSVASFAKAPKNSLPSASGFYADKIIYNAKIATLDPKNPRAQAIAIKGDLIQRVGSDHEVMQLRGPNTITIDAKKKTIIPGLIDAHTHFIRGGLTYSMEVRWDGVQSLAQGLQMLQNQAARTPAPHWVQIIGGWTWAQFEERRFPTLEEINAATGDTPAMIMHMYDRAWINQAGLRVLGWNKDTPNPFGGFIEKDAVGNPTGLLVATIGLPALVNTWLKIPRLSPQDQILSTQHFMRESNRLGLTSVIDAGGGGQNYPDNYAAIAQLAQNQQLTLRIGYELFAQAGGRELENYQNWSQMVQVGQGDDYFRMIGAGEYIVWAAGDVTNFDKDPQVIPPVMESQLSAVGKFLASNNWPFRMHTSFDATAQRVLSVLEQVHREVPLNGLRWGLDHCETISAQSLERVAAMGGSINIQNRMSLDGEAFNKRYGERVSADAPPIKRIREMGIALAAGTDGNRATSYNPWIGVHWLITGKTLGGAKLQSDQNLLSREEALGLYTKGGAWMTKEEDKKGTLEIGKLADLVLLSADFFSIGVDAIKDLESELTMVGGRVVYANGVYTQLAMKAPEIKQVWLPINDYGKYYKSIKSPKKTAQNSQQQRMQNTYSHAHPQIIGDSGVWTMECPCAF